MCVCVCVCVCVWVCVCVCVCVCVLGRGQCLEGGQHIISYPILHNTTPSLIVCNFYVLMWEDVEGPPPF